MVLDPFPLNKNHGSWLFLTQLFLKQKNMVLHGSNSTFPDIFHASGFQNSSFPRRQVILQAIEEAIRTPQGGTRWVVTRGFPARHGATPNSTLDGLVENRIENG